MVENNAEANDILLEQLRARGNVQCLMIRRNTGEGWIAVNPGKKGENEGL